MKYAADNGILTVRLDGKIDSTNASDIGEQLQTLLAQTPHTSLLIDVRELMYLSSAGLRMILGVRKQETEMRIVNASAEVYDIFEMTGFTEMLPIERAYRTLSVEGCEVIGHGAKGTVYRYNEDTAVKVYKKKDSLPAIRRERELARRAFVLDIPTAISYEIVRVGDTYGSVFELINAESYSTLILKHPERFDDYIAEYAALLQKIHRTKVRREDMPDVRVYACSWIECAAPYLPQEDVEKLQRLIDETPDTQTMLHCDYHTNNVLLQNGETILIDMDTLSHGHPIFELANIYLAHIGFGEDDPTVVERFLGLPYETARRIWDTFLPRYLGTDEPLVLADVERKAKLLASVRLLRHTVRRMKEQTETERTVIERCCCDIHMLLQQIGTLSF